MERRQPMGYTANKHYSRTYDVTRLGRSGKLEGGELSRSTTRRSALRVALIFIYGSEPYRPNRITEFEQKRSLCLPWAAQSLGGCEPLSRWGNKTHRLSLVYLDCHVMGVSSYDFKRERSLKRGRKIYQEGLGREPPPLGSIVDGLESGAYCQQYWWWRELEYLTRKYFTGRSMLDTADCNWQKRTTNRHLSAVHHRLATSNIGLTGTADSILDILRGSRTFILEASAQRSNQRTDYIKSSPLGRDHSPSQPERPSGCVEFFESG